MLRDYVARGLSLPGVRSGVDAQPWPASTHSRPSAASSANNGGDYVAGRRALLSRYAARWLLALHDLDGNAYAMLVFDLLVEQAQELPVSDEFFLGKGRDTVEKRETIITEKVLQLILKLSQASVLFTTFDDLFQKWLDRASSLNVDDLMVRVAPVLVRKMLTTSVAIRVALATIQQRVGHQLHALQHRGGPPAHNDREFKSPYHQPSQGDHRHRDQEQRGLRQHAALALPLCAVGCGNIRSNVHAAGRPR